jgi:hypothetical protein
MNTITDEEILEAILAVKSEQSLVHMSPKNIEAFVAVKATLKLLAQSSKSLQTTNNLPSLTFAEWAAQYNLKTHYDRFVAIAIHKVNEGVDAIDTKDIELMYQKARWSLPKNLADVFAKAAKQMLFTEADDPSERSLKAWRLTRTGHNHFENLAKK